MGSPRRLVAGSPFAGLVIFSVFLIWPERSRPSHGDRRHGCVRRQPR